MQRFFIKKSFNFVTFTLSLFNWSYDKHFKPKTFFGKIGSWLMKLNSGRKPTMTKPKILFVFAHPDDESFAAGCSIVHYASKNVEVHLYCATKGGAGKPGTPPLCLQEELPELRATELKQACSILGVDFLYLRDFEDGKLVDTPYDELAVDLLNHIKKVEPEIMVTFPPHGISGHKDHIQIQKICFDIVSSQIVQSVQSLYYVTIEVPATHTASPPFGHIKEEIDVVIDVGYTRQQVAQALRAHQTQHLSVARVFPGIFENKVDGIRSENVYVVAWDSPIYQQRRLNVSKPYHDLFL
jgi:LmbE family N-acetylglucosaminyl deacetylase